MPKTYAFANIVADYFAGNATPPSNTQWQISLWTASPTPSGSAPGFGGTEVTGGSYARQTFTNNAGAFTTVSNGAKSNQNVITFPTATAGWGAVVALGIHNQSGTLWAYVGITPRTIDAGDTVSIAANQLTITEA